MSNWNYADVWEIVADVQPDSIAVTQGDRNVTWREFDRGADGIVVLTGGTSRVSDALELPLRLKLVKTLIVVTGAVKFRRLFAVYAPNG